ncbi:MAG: hypothetical protein CMM02_05925, partial [Rhodopirellula sp.]|nr:hypothetical protein [Rhodopirellula sp.]
MVTCSVISGNKALECTNSNFTCAKAMSEPDDSEDNYSGDEVGEKELFGEESEGDGEGEGEGEGEAEQMDTEPEPEPESAPAPAPPPDPEPAPEP